MIDPEIEQDPNWQAEIQDRVHRLSNEFYYQQGGLNYLDPKSRQIHQQSIARAHEPFRLQSQKGE